MKTIWNHLGNIAHHAVPALLNSIWQGALLALAVWCFLKLARRVNATTAGLVWWAALATVVVLPLLNAGKPASAAPEPERRSPNRPVSRLEVPAGMEFDAPFTSGRGDLAQTRRARLLLPAGEGRGEGERMTTTAKDTNAAVSSEAQSLPTPAPATLKDAPVEAPLVGASADSLPQAASASPARQPIHLAVVADWLAVPLMFAWLLITATFLVRLAVGWRKLQQLKRAAIPAPEALQTRFTIWLPKPALRRTVRLGVSKHVATPLAAGLRRPMVLLPAKLVTELTDTEFDAVIVHELAHLRRWDDWTNFLLQSLQAILCLNPVVWFMGRQIALQREIACDDWVIATTGQPKDYATCLTRLMELARPPRLSLPAPGAWMTRGQMRCRVLALLDKRRNGTTRRSTVWILTSVAMIVAVMTMTFRWGPTIALAAPPTPAIKSESTPTPVTPAPAISLSAKEKERGLLLEEIALVEKLVDSQEKQFKANRIAEDEVIKVQRDLIVLKRQLTVLEGEIDQEKKRAERAKESENYRKAADDARKEAEARAKVEQQSQQQERKANGEKAQADYLAQKRVTLATLTQSLKSEKAPQVRYDAIDAIGRLQLPECVELLVKLFKEETDERLRMIALEGISRYRYQGEGATKALVQTYDQIKEPSIRLQAVIRICLHSDDLARQTMQHIAKDDSDSECRSVAILALGGQPPTVIPVSNWRPGSGFPQGGRATFQPLTPATKPATTPASGLPAPNAPGGLAGTPVPAGSSAAQQRPPSTVAQTPKTDEQRRTKQEQALAEKKKQEAELLARLTEIAKTDSDPKVRLSAVGGIASSDSNEAIDLLAYLAVNDPDASVRQRALGSLAHQNPASTQALLKLLDVWQDPTIRKAVVEAIQERVTVPDYRPGAPPEATTIRELTPDAAVPKLSQIALGDTDIELRKTCVYRLSVARGDLGVKALLSLYDSIKVSDVRQWIATVLGYRREDEARQKLLEIAKSDPDAACRVAAVEALGGGRNSGIRALVPGVPFQPGRPQFPIPPPPPPGPK